MHQVVEVILKDPSSRWENSEEAGGCGREEEGEQTVITASDSSPLKLTHLPSLFLRGRSSVRCFVLMIPKR